MRTNRGYLLRACCSRRVSQHHHLHLIEAHRQAGEWGSFIVKKGESCRYVFIGSSCHGEAGGGQQDILVIDLGNTLNFL